MNDLMLLVHAADLERSSLAKEAAMALSSKKDVIVKDCEIAQSTIQPQQQTKAVQINKDVSPVLCKAPQSARQVQPIVREPQHPQVNATSVRPSSSFNATKSSSSRRSMKPLTDCLVNDWSEDSLNHLHDLINKIVPRMQTEHRETSVVTNTSTPIPTLARVETCGTKWKAMFECLVRYRDEFGNCEVPARWEQNKTLAYWVVRQRTLYRRNALSSEKVQKLEHLGFTWDFSLDKYQHELATKQNISKKKQLFKKRTTTTATTTTTAARSSDKARTPLFLSTKQIRHLEGLGLRWDCFQEKRVRFHIDEKAYTKAETAHPKTSNNNKQGDTKPTATPVSSNGQVLVPRSSQADPVPFHPAPYPLFFPSPRDFNLWMVTMHQQRALQSSS